MLLSDGQVASISLADASPSLVNPNYYPTGGMALVSQFATYAAIYQAQVWVATLTNKVAYGCARLPMKVYDRATRTDARDTPYARLLRKPNGQHDPFFFWLWTASTFELYGETMWVKVRTRPNGPPTSLSLLHPANVYTRIVRADTQNSNEHGAWFGRVGQVGELEYVYHVGSASVGVMRFAQEDVVHFRAFNPNNMVRGMSRLEPLRQSLQTDDAIRRAQGAWYKNGARPSAYLTAANPLKPDALARLKADWDNIHSGIDNWGKTAILEEGMTANILQLDAQQMELIASLRLTREEACAIFDVPPPIVHILDHATFSNITEQFRSMYRDTMAPRLGLFESVLDAQLRPEFTLDDNLYAEFLMDEVLRGDFEQRVTSYAEAIRSGWLMPGEARDKENLPDAGPDTRRLYVNAAVIPLGTAAGADATGQEVNIRPQIVKSQATRTVAGRLSRITDLAEVNPATLVAGLDGDAEPVLKSLFAALADGVSVDEFRTRLRAITEEA